MTGLYERRAVAGRPRETTRADDRFLTLLAFSLKHVTATQLEHCLAQTWNIGVSSETVSQFSRQSVPLYCLCPKTHQVTPHSTFQNYKEPVNWNIHKCAYILFTAESRFSLYTSVLIILNLHKSYFPCIIRPSINFGGGSIML